MITGRDAQPDIQNRTPLEAHLATVERTIADQRKAILECIEAGKHDRAGRQSYAEWCWQARRTLNANRAIARKYRVLLAQHRATSGLLPTAAE